MPALLDLTGQKYNKLTVLHEAERMNGKTAWLCRCECGREVAVRTNSIRMGNTKSCGCIPRFNSDRIPNEKGELVRPPGYTNWLAMRKRCLYPHDKSYPDYGGRGITVCDRWLGKGGLGRFLADMGPKPTPRHTLGRIDADKGYFPGNVRWETYLEQGVNKRNTKLYSHNGQAHTITGWERVHGLANGGMHDRLRRGWSLEDAISTPRVGGVRQVSDETKPDGAKQKGDYSPEDEFTG